MTERMKYRVIIEDTAGEFEHRINEFAKEGYSIRHTMDDGTFIAVMGLKSEANVEAVKKVSHADVENHIGKDGWEVFGIYSNHTLLVRRK